MTALDQADRLGLTYQERTRTCLYTNLEPCLMCMGAAMSAYVGRVVYSLAAPSDGAVDLVRAFEPQTDSFPSYRVPEVLGGVLADEARRLMERYVAICRSPGRRAFAAGLLQGQEELP